jgi:hypothetical protein
MWTRCHGILFVLQSLPSNGSTCYSALSLRLFVPSSLRAYRHFFFSEDCAYDVCDWSLLPSLGLGAHGDYSPTAPAVPSLRPLIPSSSLKGASRSRFITIFFLQSVWVKVPRVVSASILMALKLLLMSLLSFRSWLTPPQSPVTHFLQANGGSDYLLRDLQLYSFSEDPAGYRLLSRCSCSFKSWSLIPLLQSGWVCCLLSSVHTLGALLATLSVPGPWQPCPLRGAGLAQRVIRLRVAANFFLDPPSSWVCFFGCQLHPMARSRSPYRFFSTPLSPFISYRHASILISVLLWFTSIFSR